MKVTLKQWLALIGLTVTTFVFNTSEFIPIGLLTDIGTTFSLSEAQTGLMITLYAWFVMLASLPLMLFASRFKLKELMLGVTAVFSVGQFLSAVAPNFETLILARLVVATGHAIFWSIVSVMASRVVDKNHAALALSLVSAGTAVAQIFGLPLGRAIGLALGWRATFAAVGTVSTLALIYLAVVFPHLEATEKFSLSHLPELLKNRALISLFVLTILTASAYYTGFSYIEPFMAQVAGLTAGQITLALMVFGFSGLFGTILFSKLYNKHKQTFVSAAVMGLTLALLLLRLGALGFASMICNLVLWGMSNGAFGIAFQAVLIDVVDEHDATVAMSMYSGLFNFGIGFGTALGGFVVNGPGIASIGLVGGGIGVAASIFMLLVMAPVWKRAAR